MLKYKFHLLFGIIFVSLSNFFRVLLPRTIRDALDYVFNTIQEYRLLDGTTFQEDLYAQLAKQLMIFGGLVLGFAVIMGVFMYFMRQTIIVMSRLIEFDMRKEIFTHYTRLDLQFFKENKTGDLMARISEDVSKVRMYLGPALLYGANLISLFGIVIYSMFSVSTTLSLYTLIPLPILSISIYIVSSIINKKSTLIQKQLSIINTHAQEVFSGIRVIKAYVKENQFGNYFDEECLDYKSKSLGLARVYAMVFPLMILLISVSTVLTLYLGGKQVEAGLITPGNIAEFIIYVNMLTWPITALGWVASLIQQAAASQERINEFLDVQPSIHATGNIIPENWQIEFRNVSFTYPETGIQALKNVSFILNSGEKLAIFGKTASGKTTIVELLMRMYDVTEGEILIDGHNIKDIDVATLREKIAYVPQDVFLFSDTITENIRFGSHNDNDVQKFAEYASVHKDIVGLPEEYNTVVGERGVTLSGGQKQRISLARGLIKEPEISILDDSLSAVDANTENTIVDYFNTSLAEKTTIIITHRIQSKMLFDNIIVMKNGHIENQGSHIFMLKNNVFYRDLFEHQITQ